MNVAFKKIEYKLLADCPYCIPQLARLWFDELGQRWIPRASVEHAKQLLEKHLNNDELPFTFVAIDKHQAIGMASLRINDGIREDLVPWLGGVVVEPRYRHQRIGSQLIELVKNQAKEMGFKKLYLLAFELAIVKWYEHLSWKIIGADQFYHHLVTVMEIDI